MNIYKMVKNGNVKLYIAVRYIRFGNGKIWKLIYVHMYICQMVKFNNGKIW